MYVLYINLEFLCPELQIKRRFKYFIVQIVRWMYKAASRYQRPKKKLAHLSFFSRVMVDKNHTQMQKNETFCVKLWLC